MQFVTYPTRRHPPSNSGILLSKSYPCALIFMIFILLFLKEYVLYFVDVYPV